MACRRAVRCRGLERGGTFDADIAHAPACARICILTARLLSVYFYTSRLCGRRAGGCHVCRVSVRGDALASSQAPAAPRSARHQFSARPRAGISGALGADRHEPEVRMALIFSHATNSSSRASRWRRRQRTRLLGSRWRRVLAACALTAITISGAAFLPSRAHSDAAPANASHTPTSPVPVNHLPLRLVPR